MYGLSAGAGAASVVVAVCERDFTPSRIAWVSVRAARYGLVGCKSVARASQTVNLHERVRNVGWHVGQPILIR